MDLNTLFIAIGISLLVGGACGWYVTSHGVSSVVASVQTEINNIKADIENLKTKTATPAA